MNKLKIGVLVGSLRKGAYSKLLAENLKELAADSMELEVIEIANLNYYNEEYDEDVKNTPKEYVEFRNKAKTFDGFIFVTPEYNRSYPAVLKNALDVGSRPYGANVWNNKTALVVSHSIGGMGGFGANQHLRQVLSALNLITLAQPEVYLGGVGNFFNEDGKLSKEGTIKYLKSVLVAFAEFTNKLK